MSKQTELLDMTAVGRVIGEVTGRPLSARTVSAYMARSKPGGRYAGHPFPEPNGRIYGIPYWLPGRVREIKRWAKGRPGAGAGGGRPRKVTVAMAVADAGPSN